MALLLYLLILLRLGFSLLVFVLSVDLVYPTPFQCVHLILHVLDLDLLFLPLCICLLLLLRTLKPFYHEVVIGLYLSDLLKFLLCHFLYNLL